MLNIKKYAAIDIGSNAIRLLISNVIEEPGKAVKYKKTSLVRVPVRLGADVFLNGEISEANTMRLLDSMLAFRLLMKTHKVDAYKACATSAMREAENGSSIADRIYEHANIRIEIIDGEQEAAIIASTDLQDFIDEDKTYLYVDVGGGSTEFTVIRNSTPMASKSVKIGTVRLLNDMVGKTTWSELEDWIKTNTAGYDRVDVIGSGGNINKIFKISGKAIGKPLTYFYMTTYFDTLNSHSYEERVTELDLNPDRTDVIIPATRIYLLAMKWSKAKHLYVPKMGLSDGIIRCLHEDSVSSYPVI